MLQYDLPGQVQFQGEQTMPQQPTGQVTQLLTAIQRGDEDAHEKLWSAIYDELHAIARHQMADEPANQTLQPTALVNEAYMRLVGSDGDIFTNRRLFFATATKIMREIRVDYARKRKSQKRGGGERPGHLHEEMAILDEDPTKALAIDEALRRLEQVAPRKAEIATMRYFAGLTVKECAETLDLSTRMVDKEWRLARAWLHRELSKGDSSLGERDQP